MPNIKIPVSKFPDLKRNPKIISDVVEIADTRFKHYRLARRVFPMSDKGPGYTVEDLLMAIQMVGSPFKLDTNSFEGKDAIKKLYEFSIPDAMLLRKLFTETFIGNNDDMLAGAEYARELLKSTAQDSYTIPKEKFPLPQYSVTLMRPNTQVRIACNSRYTSEAETGVDLDEYIISSMVQSINGEPIGNRYSVDPPSVFDDLYPMNFLWLKSVFFVLFLPNNTEFTSDAIEEGKSYRAQLLSELSMTTSNDIIVSTRKGKTTCSVDVTPVS